MARRNKQLFLAPANCAWHWAPRMMVATSETLRQAPSVPQGHGQVQREKNSPELFSADNMADLFTKREGRHKTTQHTKGLSVKRGCQV